MAAQLQKTFQCMTCKTDIKLQRKDDDSGWLRFNLDGSAHIHPTTRRGGGGGQQQQQQQLPQQQQQQPVQQQPQQPTTTTTDLSKEVAAIKAQLLVLVSRLDRIEQELQK